MGKTRNTCWNDTFISLPLGWGTLSLLSSSKLSTQLVKKQMIFFLDIIFIVSIDLIHLINIAN